MFIKPFAATGLTLPLLMCGMPGISMDASRLGNAPIAQQVDHMTSFDDEYASKFSSQWFAERCPDEELNALLACAEKLGLVCEDKLEQPGSGTLCMYRSQYRMRRVEFTILPSVDGKPTSPRAVIDVEVTLELAPEGGARIVFNRRADETSCQIVPMRSICAKSSMPQANSSGDQ